MVELLFLQTFSPSLSPLPATIIPLCNSFPTEVFCTENLPSNNKKCQEVFLPGEERRGEITRLAAPTTGGCYAIDILICGSRASQH